MFNTISYHNQIMNPPSETFSKATMRLKFSILNINSMYMMSFSPPFIAVAFSSKYNLRQLATYGQY